MHQITFACQLGFEKYARASHREQFLNTMGAVVPWAELEVLILAYYSKAGKTQPIGASRPNRTWMRSKSSRIRLGLILSAFFAESVGSRCVAAAAGVRSAIGRIGALKQARWPVGEFARMADGE